MLRGARRVGLLVAVMTTGLLLAAPASADHPGRPFHGYVSGSVTFVDDSTDPFTLEPCQFYEATGAFGYGSGTASHLGRIDWASVHCTPGPDGAVTGLLTLTAANGDELVLEYVGPTSGEAGSNYYRLVYTYTVIDGDGRFEDADGTGDMTVYTTFEDFADPVWPAEWWLEGWIDF